MGLEQGGGKEAALRVTAGLEIVIIFIILIIIITTSSSSSPSHHLHHHYHHPQLRINVAIIVISKVCVRFVELGG